MKFKSKIFDVTYDILHGVNTTGVVEEAEKIGKIVKTGLSEPDVVIGTSHTLKDFVCQNYVCVSLDVIGSISSNIGFVLGNIPGTKHLTLITSFVTVGCRSVRYNLKKYRSF